MTERDKIERAWLEDEVRLAARLTDADRFRIFLDLLQTADAIQRNKSPEQLWREEEVRRLLDEAPGPETVFRGHGPEFVSFGALIPLIHQLEDIFESLQVTRSYGGAIACNFYAPPRFTQDIDLLVLVPAIKIPSFVDKLSAIGCVQNVDQPAPLSAEPILQQLRSKPYLCMLYCSGIRTELFAPWHPFHHSVLERSPVRDLGGRNIRIHAPEDLIVFKKIFDRPKDIMDIKAILLSQKGHLDLARVRTSAQMLLNKESLEELGRLLQEYS